MKLNSYNLKKYLQCDNYYKSYVDNNDNVEIICQYNDEVITAVLDSSDSIGDNAVVKLDDGSEATFDFELLKSSEDKSDCLAYQVSIQPAPQDSVLGASDDNTQDEDVSISEDVQNVSGDEDTSKESEVLASGEDETTAQETTDQDNNTEINETNKTIINKTNTVIINEKNTTVITKNNVNNDTPENTLLKTAGNPLFILVIVIILIAVVLIVKHKKG